MRKYDFATANKCFTEKGKYTYLRFIFTRALTQK